MHLAADTGTILAAIRIDRTGIDNDITVTTDAGTFLTAESSQCTLTVDGQRLASLCKNRAAIVLAVIDNVCGTL